MKKLLTLLALVGIFSCTKELGGEDGPINVPSNTVLNGNINTTITLTSDKVWTLKGYVYVTDGAKIIIQPGTTIVSDIAEKGALCIERGAQIIAEGTSTKPIIFTSGKNAGERSPGDWGGIVILGRAKTNRSSEPTIEGGIGRAFGGTNDADNSGVLKYVRIEYAHANIGKIYVKIMNGWELDELHNVYISSPANNAYPNTRIGNIYEANSLDIFAGNQTDFVQLSVNCVEGYK